MPTSKAVANKRELGEICGVSPQAIDGWLSRGCPYLEKGAPLVGYKFDTAEVIAWLRQRDRTEALMEMSKVDESEAKRRKLAAEASLAELELAVKQGAAVSVEDFEAAWAAMIGAARAKLLGLPMALGPEVAGVDDPAECAALIQSAVHEALFELSEYPPNLPQSGH